MTEQAKPLAGLKVAEFTHMVMGPTAGLILADLGADIIKIEPLKGDNTRRLKGSGGGYFAMYNRNKSSLCLDLVRRLASDPGCEYIPLHVHLPSVVHLNAFFPSLIILHFFQLFFYNSKCFFYK